MKSEGLPRQALAYSPSESRLRPVLEDEIKIVRTFWMSMPEEVRQLPRMRATWEFIRRTVESERPMLLSGVDGSG